MKLGKTIKMRFDDILKKSAMTALDLPEIAWIRPKSSIKEANRLKLSPPIALLKMFKKCDDEANLGQIEAKQA